LEFGTLNNATREKLIRFWREWLRPLLLILILTSSFRSAIADWNDVPTGSMKPTIMEGDRIFVNKLAYDLKIPFTTAQIAKWDNPKRGEVVVLFSPYDGKRLVKRVVGIPGDRIELKNNKLYVNSNPVEYDPLDPKIIDDIPSAERPMFHFSLEDLTGRKHPVMTIPGRASADSFDTIHVPPHHYFVMGDNRDNSFDSRYFGPVDRSQIVGRAVAVVASLNPRHYYLPRWHRFFTRLP
jgi:signal peptidase I